MKKKVINIVNLKELCENCEYGDEAGQCEGRGVKWSKGTWNPTLLCVPNIPYRLRFPKDAQERVSKYEQ